MEEVNKEPPLYKLIRAIFPNFPLIQSSFKGSQLGKKLLYSILFFSTIVTLLQTSLQIYLDYRSGVKSTIQKVDEIKRTQMKSLAQNIWNINNKQIELQLKGLLEIDTVKSLKVTFIDGESPIEVIKSLKKNNDTIHRFPIFYERKEKKEKLGELEVVTDLSPVIDALQSRVLIILLTQGAKTFLVSLFILFIFNLLVHRHLMKISNFAREISIDNMSNKLKLSRRDYEVTDELDDMANNLNLMQMKIRSEIHEKRNYQEQLLQSQKMEALGTLASGIAHDFNNILQGLYNALFILEEEVIDNADALAKINTAGSLVDRARELVKQILIYTKQQTSIFKRFAPIPPIQDVVEILRVAKSKAVNIDLFIDPPQGYLYGDKTQLKQVILNLGNNAIQALEGRPDGHIKIWVSPVELRQDNRINLAPGNYLEVVLRDNGSGIPKDILNRIFEPFFTTKDIDKGTGLGLSVVQGIVHRHNGEIIVKSKVGEGTSFKVYLPIFSESTDETKKILYTGNEEIIFVSSSAVMREAFGKIANKTEHKLNFIDSAEEALPLLKVHQDGRLFVIDDTIEDFGSEELIRKLRQFNKSSPILNISRTDSMLAPNLKVATINRSAFVEDNLAETARNLPVKVLKDSLQAACELVG